jgi:hypothetical protein
VDRCDIERPSHPQDTLIPVKRGEWTGTPYNIMKPAITRLTHVRATTVICCPRCIRLISCEAGKAPIVCHACNAIVKDEDLPMSLNGRSQPD